MRSFSYNGRLEVLLAITFLFYCCSKKSGGSDDAISQDFLKTPVGTAVGNPVTKTIGAAGGTVISPDGTLELNIPAGALTANTDIKIEPVTNELPGGIGLAYDLLPDGTKFKKEVTLTFHYKKQDINGDPFSLFIAFQDSAGIWLADMDHRNFDTTANTISLGTWHFTGFGLADNLKCTANPIKLKANETSEVIATEIVREHYNGPITTVDGALPVRFTGIVNYYIQVPDKLIINWYVNKPIGRPGGTIGGNAEDGFIIGNGGKVTYKAPAHIDRSRKVRVSFTMRPDYKLQLLGKDHELPGGKLERGVEIELVPDEETFNFNVSFKILDSMVSPFNPAVLPDIPVYMDRASIDLKIKVQGPDVLRVSVDTSNLLNYAPTVTPASKHYSVVTYTWIPDDIGLINISDVVWGVVIGQDSIVHFTVYHKNTYYPGSKLVYDDGLTETSQPTLQGDVGFPGRFDIDLKKRNAETTFFYVGIGASGSITITPG